MTINITSLIQRATGALLVSLCFALRHHRLLSRSRAAHGFRLTRGLLARRAAPARSAATPMARLPAHGGAARTPAGWLGRLANPYLLPLLLGTLATGTQAATCQNNLPPRNPDDIYTVDAANGVVTDSRTGLMWKRVEEISTMNWSQALAYAEAHSFAGYSDWRLPNIKELQRAAKLGGGMSGQSQHQRHGIFWHI